LKVGKSSALKVVLFNFLMVVSIASYLSMDGDSVNFSIVLVVFFSIMSVISTFILKGDITLPRDHIFILVGLMVFSAVVSTLVAINDLSSEREISYVLRFLLPLLFLTSVSILMTGLSGNHIEMIVAVSSASFLLFFGLLITESYHASSEFGFLKQTNWGNITIAFSPLVALSRYKSVRIFLVVLLTFSIMYSLKRSGALFLLFSLIFYLGFNISQDGFLQKKRFERVLYFLVASPVFILILFYAASTSEFIEIFLIRLESISEDGGSGRLGLWVSLLDNFFNSNLMKILFGDLSGSASVLAATGIHSAHNDYVGSLVNFGVFGFVLFVSFLIFSYLSSSRFIKVTGRHNILAVLFFLGSIFTFSLTSGLFVYSTMFLPLFLMLAIMLISKK